MNDFYADLYRTIREKYLWIDPLIRHELNEN